MAKDGTSEEGGAGTQEGEGIVKREEGEGDGEGEETLMEDGGRV